MALAAPDRLDEMQRTAPRPTEVSETLQASGMQPGVAAARLLRRRGLPDCAPDGGPESGTRAHARPRGRPQADAEPRRSEQPLQKGRDPQSAAATKRGSTQKR